MDHKLKLSYEVLLDHLTVLYYLTRALGLTFLELTETFSFTAFIFFAVINASSQS